VILRLPQGGTLAALLPSPRLSKAEVFGVSLGRKIARKSWTCCLFWFKKAMKIFELVGDIILEEMSRLLLNIFPMIRMYPCLTVSLI
jgi:hypothetical protein